MDQQLDVDRRRVRRAVPAHADPPALRYNDKILPWALILLVIASWIDKSLGLLIGGFVPNMFETVTEYTPTIPEILVALGVYGLGGIIISVLWKIAMDVKKETERSR